MLRDLKETGEKSLKCNTQVCIIGAGTAGLFLAAQLRKKGIEVTVLEGGGRRSRPLKGQCVFQDSIYHGADEGRSFGLGGTSVLWGGQMLPLTESDLSRRPWVLNESWPLEYSEIKPYIQKVRHVLGLKSRILEDPLKSTTVQKWFPLLSGIEKAFMVRLSEWIPFGKRNMFHLFRKEIEDDEKLVVWLNANVVDMSSEVGTTTSRISSVKAVGSNGNELLIDAEYVVICAGTLESTRLMLEYNEKYSGCVTNAGAPLGKFFSDHLSVSAGKLISHGKRKSMQSLMPVFDNGVMRTPRLELSPYIQKEEEIPSAFVHFPFNTTEPAGLDVVREVLRGRQQGKRPISMFENVGMLRVTKDISALAYQRFLKKRLWIPPGAEVSLQIDIEQVPQASNQLFLTEDRDEYHRKKLAIEWRISSRDIEVVEKVLQILVSIWRETRIARYAELHLNEKSEENAYRSLYDVYHPTGTLRMGASPSNSIVNRDLRVWCIENCYISSTAVFPTAGSANPGLTHLALTMRLAEHISKILAR
ncbi:GMC family oxidoreductase [Candidatus Parcubacteria bacterium]|nr:MAG: GMC family oxidoreductase [Candidatus Parcubacteria bacterium]